MKAFGISRSEAKTKTLGFLVSFLVIKGDNRIVGSIPAASWHFELEISFLDLFTDWNSLVFCQLISPERVSVGHMGQYGK